jgi:outer membrane protein assembly factor BamB
MFWRCVLLGAMLALSSLPAGADDWPQFRGPGRDNKVTGFTAPATWPKELKKAWEVKVGSGVASPVLVGDKIYVFVRAGGDEVLKCLNAATGKEVWTEKYAAEEVTMPAKGFPGQEPFEGPRATPAVGEGKVCTLGVGGTVSCFDAATGKSIWRNETKLRPIFFTSCSPLIADGKCIVHIGGVPEGAKGFGGGGKGGKGELIAYSLADGKAAWKWSGDGPGYGSPVLATIHGVKQVVEQTDQNLIGVAMADGKLLWQTALKTGRYQTQTPVIDGNTVICGGSSFTIQKTGDEFKAEPGWVKNPPATYNTPVLKDGVLYGLAAGGGGGKGKGPATTRLFAQDAKTGEVLWTDSATRGECGAVLDAGEVLLLMSSDMNLVPFKPDRKEFKELARYKVASLPTFAMPIVSDKRIYVKDRESLTLWSLE